MIVGLLACFGVDLCCCSSKLCGHLCLHIRAHMQKARARHPVPFSVSSHFISLSQGLSLTLKLIVLGQLPSQRAPGSYLFLPPNAEVTGTGSPHLLCGYWRFELRASRLQGKCSYPRSHLPSHESQVCTHTANVTVKKENYLLKTCLCREKALLRGYSE